MNLLSTSCTHPLVLLPLESEMFEEMPDDPNVATNYYYEEPYLADGVEGVDYYIAYGDETSEEVPDPKE